jgi:2-hydroxy-3-keto-5-methylthiopentenyl-1-phosphate phosphatase
MQPIAIIFDFDDTLTHDSTSRLLESLGVDADKFWKEEVQLLDKQDWDPIPAYQYALVQLSKRREEGPITKRILQEFARKMKFHPGVTKMTELLQQYTKAKYPDINLEFYIISSGIGEIVRNTKIASQFTDIWASEFLYEGENEEIAFPKKVISFTDKTRYIFQISKGIIGEKSRNNPFEVNKRVNYKDFRIKMEHMIFIGDGYTDVPCFSLIKRYNGVTFAVYDKHRQDRWGKAWNFMMDGRVSGVLSADYTKDSDLTRNLMMAIDSIAYKLQNNG